MRSWVTRRARGPLALSAARAAQEGNDVVMVQEYAEGGDLYRLLHRNGGRWAVLPS